MLRDYLGNARVIAAADEFEQAWQLFTRLRTALRLSAKGKSPLHDPYLLQAEESRVVQQSLEALREECRCKRKSLRTPGLQSSVLSWCSIWTVMRRCCSTQIRGKRTTNPLESHWSKAKRCCRKRHGRKKLTRDFQCLPPEVMLVPNLQSPEYAERVLGDLSELPAKLAQAAQSAPPWTGWRKNLKPINTGRFPHASSAERT